jgi:ubiquinone/menaquinone biosynthesis C-methylase UbiE
VTIGAAPATARPGMTDVQAALYETFVIPSFAHVFGGLVLRELIPSEDARVAHIGCRSGYPDLELLGRLPNAHLFGRDPSVSSIELARAKARASGLRGRADYALDGASELLPAGAFSHAYSVLPPFRNVAGTLREHHRVLGHSGQSMLALPLSGSFEEPLDLLREYALKYDVHELSSALDVWSQQMPTAKDLTALAEAAGLRYASVVIEETSLRFQSGMQFFEDPAVRMFILPELEALCLRGSLDPYGGPFRYVREAFDTYFGERGFEVRLVAAVLSSRR